MTTQEHDAAAEQFDRLFRQIYLSYHRRDPKRGELSGASRATLTHLSIAGPLTVGELAGHLDRAQSVTSDIVAGLERKGLLERRADPSDRRRSMVWLSEAGLRVLAADAAVLDLSLLAAGLGAMPAEQLVSLTDALHALLDAAQAGGDPRRPEKRRPHEPGPATGTPSAGNPHDEAPDEEIPDEEDEDKEKDDDDHRG